MKFKIGDKVRILDGSKIEDYAADWVDGMNEFVGEVSTVRHVAEYYGKPYCILECDAPVHFKWDERGLELVETADQPKEDKPKEDKPKVEVNPRANKEHFMEVAAEITHDKFTGIIAKNPELVLLLAMFSSELANALFD